MLNIPLKLEFMKYTVLSPGDGRGESWCISHYGFHGEIISYH